MNYTVKLNKDYHSDIDDYEKEDDNFATVKVLDEYGNEINSKSRVMITCSKNALLGLGSELIRLAHDFQDGRHQHISALSKEEVCQSMGVYLTPDSSELIVACGEQGKVDDFLED